MSIGKLLAQARRDVAKIAASGGFEDDITLSTPDGATSVAVKGLSTGRWQDFDTEGNKVNSASFHIAIPEQQLADLEYPVRGSNGKVKLTGHQISVKDNTGTTRHYVINECYPNSTTGLLVCILGRRE